MVDLSLSQPLGIAKQFTIIPSINLSRAGGTRDEPLCMPDETALGNQSFGGRDKGNGVDGDKRGGGGGGGAGGAHSALAGGQGVMLGKDLLFGVAYWLRRLGEEWQGGSSCPP